MARIVLRGTGSPAARPPPPDRRPFPEVRSPGAQVRAPPVSAAPGSVPAAVRPPAYPSASSDLPASAAAEFRAEKWGLADFPAVGLVPAVLARAAECRSLQRAPLADLRSARWGLRMAWAARRALHFLLLASAGERAAFPHVAG